MDSRKALAAVFEAMKAEEVEIDLGLALRTKLNSMPREVPDGELEALVKSFVPGRMGLALWERIKQA